MSNTPKNNAFIVQYGTNCVLWEGYISPEDREAWWNEPITGTLDYKYYIHRPATEKGPIAE